ncbi:hypothetical protein OBBRIDRAFT_835188 [Obba rivulosa]|uniref:Uncharacterized protein n=1 Tax=Obba rivulosa TaxID=1052685 RepID=A0A8E2DKM2_9APHY|nr:hypothetical protein OBBRIDRAFT_835188 [Obba rivulosa]
MFGEEIIFNVGKEGVKFILKHRPGPVIRDSYALLGQSSHLIVYNFDHIPVDERGKFAEDATRIFSELRILEKRIKEAKSWPAKLRFYIPAIAKAHDLSAMTKDIAAEAETTSQYAQIRILEKMNCEEAENLKDDELPGERSSASSTAVNMPESPPLLRCRGTGAIVLSPHGDYNLDIPSGKEAEITCILRDRSASSNHQLVTLTESIVTMSALPVTAIAVCDPYDAKITVLSPYGQYNMNIPPGKEVEISCKLRDCSELCGATPLLTVSRTIDPETHDERTIIVVPALVQPDALTGSQPGDGSALIEMDCTNVTASEISSPTSPYGLLLPLEENTQPVTVAAVAA